MKFRPLPSTSRKNMRQKSRGNNNNKDKNPDTFSGVINLDGMDLWGPTTTSRSKKKTKKFPIKLEKDFNQDIDFNPWTTTSDPDSPSTPTISRVLASTRKLKDEDNQQDERSPQKVICVKCKTKERVEKTHTIRIRKIAADLSKVKEQLKTAEKAVLVQKRSNNTLQRSKNEYESTLSLLEKEIQRLHSWTLQVADEHKPIHRNTLEDGSVLALTKLFKRFDRDKDGVLKLEEINNLMSATQTDEFHTADTYQKLCNELEPTTNSTTGLSITGLYNLYLRQGTAKFHQDLDRLNIPLVSSQTGAHMLLEQCTKHLSEIQADVKTAVVEYGSLKAKSESQAMMYWETRRELEDMTQKHEREQKMRLETEIQKKALEGQKERLMEEAQQANRSNSQSQVEVLNTREALIKMRSLLDTQVADVEKWHRMYLEAADSKAELETILENQQRDLERLRKQKAIEDKKSRMMYMEAPSGRKHWNQDQEK